MKNFESYESNRWIWRVNLALQVVLVLALVVLVNYIGMTVWTRIDLTKHRTYSLSGETLAYISKLDQPVRVVVTIPADEDDPLIAQTLRDVRGVLREFEYAARGNRPGTIRVEFLNVFQNRARAEQLGVSEMPNVIVFEATQSGLKRIIQLAELYEFADRERRQFKGERVFALALVDVSKRQLPVLYFLTGHGEMKLTGVDPGRGATQLDRELTVRAYRTAPLDLLEAREIPKDADEGMIIVLAPRTPLLRSEQELLRDYLKTRSGRVLLALDPGTDHGLDDLLYDWGILVEDVLVNETDPKARLTTGELLIRWVAPEHPITAQLAEAGFTFVFGAARSARPDPGRAFDDSLVVTDLLGTSSASWGEADYRTRPYVFDRRDLRGPITIATAAERKVADTNLRGGRLIVFGSGDFVSNVRLAQGGNAPLFLKSISWALDLDRRFTIAARPVERLKLTLSEQQLAVTSGVIIMGPALVVTAIGLLVFFSRRR